VSQGFLVPDRKLKTNVTRERLFQELFQDLEGGMVYSRADQEQALDLATQVMTRNRLLGYCRTGRRLEVLAGRAPLLVFIFSQVADTIVYVLLSPLLVETHDSQRQNNSITESSIRALAARIEQNHPELTRTLMGLGEYAGLTSAHTVRNIPQLEDVVAETYHLLGPALTDITTAVSTRPRETSSGGSWQGKMERRI
jgi:hypothetical protein